MPDKTQSTDNLDVLGKNITATLKSAPIPKIIHFIYLNEIPLELIYGGKYLIGLQGICNMAEQEGYQVNLWVPNRRKFNQYLLKVNPSINALLDPHTNISFPNLKVRSLDELDSEIATCFTNEYGFTNEFPSDLKRCIYSEQVQGFNLAAASNIWRLVILALIGGIYCDLSKTPPKDIEFDKSSFDNLLKKVKFGFAQKNQGNYLLISQAMHTVVLETLKFIVENYNLIYRVSFNNLSKNENTKLIVLKKQCNEHNPYIEFIEHQDPVSYARSMDDQDFREASTEILNGVYALEYGIIKHFMDLFSLYYGPLNHKIHITGITCLNDKLNYDYRHNTRKFTGDLFDTITSDNIPLRKDYEIEENTPPLALGKEQMENKNWRDLHRIYHDDSSILFSSNKAKSDFFGSVENRICELDDSNFKVIRANLYLTEYAEFLKKPPKIIYNQQIIKDALDQVVVDEALLTSIMQKPIVHDLDLLEKIVQLTNNTQTLKQILRIDSIKKESSIYLQVLTKLHQNAPHDLSSEQLSYLVDKKAIMARDVILRFEANWNFAALKAFLDRLITSITLALGQTITSSRCILFSTISKDEKDKAIESSLHLLNKSLASEDAQAIKNSFESLCQIACKRRNWLSSILTSEYSTDVKSAQYLITEFSKNDGLLEALDIDNKQDKENLLKAICKEMISACEDDKPQQGFFASWH